MPFENIARPVRVSCYANVVCPLLFNTRLHWDIGNNTLNIDNIVQKFLNPEMTFFKSRESSHLYSSVALRQEIHGEFSSLTEQHSAHDFLHFKICDKSSTEMRENFVNKVKRVSFCSACRIYEHTSSYFCLSISKEVS